MGSIAIGIALITHRSLVQIQPPLFDVQGQVRSAALAALGEMKIPQNIELISSLLLDGDLEVQGKAVELLIKLGDPETCK